MRTKPSLPTQKLTVTLVQNSAGRDIARNLARIERLLDGAPPGDLIALPEVFALRGADGDYRLAAEIFPGPILRWVAKQARRRRAWILAGGVIEKAGRRIFNTCVLTDRSGRVAACYRKMHLFEARLETGQVIRERDIYSPGDRPVLVEIEGWRCGLAICYDLRFPELFRIYAERGAHLFCVPSNFTQKTGRDHWETLLRARAIENQVFVVAPNQCGANPVTGIASHGHSLALGPWGEILCRAKNSARALTVTLDPADLARTRGRIPVLEHRRFPAPRAG